MVRNTRNLTLTSHKNVSLPTAVSAVEEKWRGPERMKWWWGNWCHLSGGDSNPEKGQSLQRRVGASRRVWRAGQKSTPCKGSSRGKVFLPWAIFNVSGWPRCSPSILGWRSKDLRVCWAGVRVSIPAVTKCMDLGASYWNCLLWLSNMQNGDNNTYLTRLFQELNE